MMEELQSRDAYRGQEMLKTSKLESDHTEKTVEVSDKKSLRLLLFHVNLLASQVTFEPGYSKINESSYSVLKQIVKLLQNVTAPLIIEGCINVVNRKGNRLDVNSSKIKIYEENCDALELGLRRAEKVANYLRSQGALTRYLIPTFSKENKPICNDASNVATNRRCEFRMVTNDDKNLTNARKEDLNRFTSIIHQYLGSVKE